VISYGGSVDSRFVGVLSGVKHTALLVQLLADRLNVYLSIRSINLNMFMSNVISITSENKINVQ
jgi:hypothetical protein